jgi:hypothetical protein
MQMDFYNEVHSLHQFVNVESCHWGKFEGILQTSWNRSKTIDSKFTATGDQAWCAKCQPLGPWPNSCLMTMVNSNFILHLIDTVPSCPDHPICSNYNNMFWLGVFHDSWPTFGQDTKSNNWLFVVTGGVFDRAAHKIWTGKLPETVLKVTSHWPSPA